MKKLIISTVIFLLCISPFALGKNQSPNNELLEEIDIMEAVLSRLIGKNANTMPLLDSNAKGFYLNDYGVIFNVAYPIKHNIAWINGVLIPEETDAKPVTGMVELQKGQRLLTIKDEDKIEKKDVIPGIKKSLITFFIKYASSISELKPDENITVILDLNGFSFTPSNKKGDLPQQLTATLSMDDIGDFRRNKISDKELEKRIVFNEIESVDQDVSIFSNVLQASLDHMKEGSGPGFGFHGNVRSIYLKGHGILFMLDADVGPMTIRLINNSLKDLEKNLKGIEWNLKGAGTAANKKIVTKSMIEASPQTDDFKEYEEKLIKIISKYGHTLSNIKSGEYVEIALRLNKLALREDFSKGLIKVKKGDIDDFHKGKINFDSFKKKVSVVYY